MHTYKIEYEYAAARGDVGAQPLKRKVHTVRAHSRDDALKQFDVTVGNHWRMFGGVHFSGPLKIYSVEDD